ncbi:hypothetical protein ACQZ44_12565 [Agrobacterium vitis]
MNHQIAQTSTHVPFFVSVGGDADFAHEATVEFPDYSGVAPSRRGPASIASDIPDVLLKGRPGVTTSQVVLRNPAGERQETRVVKLHSRKDHTKVRFRRLRRLQDNHDGEGARAAVSSSVDFAIAFLDRHTFGLPFMATLNDDGLAVIEVQNRKTRLFASITFFTDGLLNCIVSKGREYYETADGKESSDEVVKLLSIAEVL